MARDCNSSTGGYWDSDPFGSTAPNENPSGLGTFTFNPRFPGQYYDSETGLSQNMMRDYDPAVGRYVDSNPIGQHLYFSLSIFPSASISHRGYWNHLYNYADGRSVSLKDPSGLGAFDWFLDLFKEKTPEEMTTKAVASALSALCILRNCGQKRDSLELYGDCSSILNDWVRKQGEKVIAAISAITANGRQATVAECAKFCGKGIKTGSCCKDGKK